MVYVVTTGILITVNNLTKKEQEQGIGIKKTGQQDLVVRYYLT
jgi:hypothetical protein